MGRIASIDFGLKRVGIALSDEGRRIASSLPTILIEGGMRESVKRTTERLAPYNLDAIVVGLPLYLDGRSSEFTLTTKAFIEALKGAVGCPVIPWEERLSTLEAERILRSASLSRKRRSMVIDGVVATLLLQSYLDALPTLAKA